MFKIISNKKYKALIKEIEDLKVLPSKFQKIEIENRKIIELRAQGTFHTPTSLLSDLEVVKHNLFFELMSKIVESGLYQVQIREVSENEKRIIIKICVVTPKLY